MVCYRCKSDNVTTFSKAKLYFKTWGPLNIKNYINAELVYLCNDCQAALILVHIYNDYSRKWADTSHYPSLRVGYTKKFIEEEKAYRAMRDRVLGEYRDGFAEYVSSRMGNFHELTLTPVREYKIRDICIECSEEVGECKKDPFVCNKCGSVRGESYDECPKRIRDRTMYVDLHGHEVEV